MTPNGKIEYRGKIIALARVDLTADRGDDMPGQWTATAVIHPGLRDSPKPVPILATGSSPTDAENAAVERARQAIDKSEDSSGKDEGS